MTGPSNPAGAIMTDKHRMFLPVGISHDDGDYKEYLSGEISITPDAKGRIYIDAGGHSVGINLPDLMRFIQNEMRSGLK